MERFGSQKRWGLLCSIFYEPYQQRVEDQFILTKWISVAIVHFLRESLGLSNAFIKWPNDIYVGRKKLGGILIENAVQGKYVQSSVIGLGLNVFQESFEESLPNAVSLRQLLGKNAHLNRELILIQIITSFYNQVNRKKEFVDKDYLDYLMLRGIKAPYTIFGKKQEAKLIGVIQMEA